MGLFSNIENALNIQLSSIGGLPTIQWSNTKYQPIENTSFIRPSILPAQSDLETLAGGESVGGIYQIDIFTPSEKGVGVSNKIIDDIAESFRANKTLSAGGNTVFVQAISRGTAEREEAWFHSFVSINFICHS